jgi:hypothetical protein
MQWQVIRNTALRGAVNRLHHSGIHPLNGCLKDQWSAALESTYPEDQTQWWEFPLRVSLVIDISETEKADVLDDRLETQF